jgi:hypothetical protein
VTEKLSCLFLVLPLITSQLHGMIIITLLIEIELHWILPRFGLIQFEQIFEQMQNHHNSYEASTVLIANGKSCHPH